ncbi:cupin domain-containing protein [Paenibacillus hamazuiensis]|uniref:cupin domain-containing protein n=1 Tax=Paenibacillus hamazuiensis TaxID=2936508 RepID=UPI00200E8198|nr:cupin domain-containing protein [Paenibacillus hamazuiensis]
MIVRNFLQAEYKVAPSHKGSGDVKSVRLFDDGDFETKLKFFYYTEIPPKSSIGYHKHGDNEEVYAILEGEGTMTVNGESRKVTAGDVILNKRGWSHGLENHSDAPLKIIVFEAEI